MDLLDQRLAPAIRSWKFQAGSIDGQPAITQTHLQLLPGMRKKDADRHEIVLLQTTTGIDLRETPPLRKHHVNRIQTCRKGSPRAWSGLCMPGTGCEVLLAEQALGAHDMKDEY